ncbi:MAG: helix-turn-helix domain-containing protein [Cyclobacteriaceae bacterium]|nr:helix-turn-helix domain-containing protein [Cyclobacteriaceae bacterium]
MPENKSLQQTFLELVKQKHEYSGGFADDLAELLCISKDSAYRRIRGETPLQFDEIQKLSLHYDISIDHLLHVDNSVISFVNRTINYNDYTLKEYLISVHEDLDIALHQKINRLIFAAKDIPPFHFFQFEELTHFKLYFWLQNLVRSEELKDANYSREIISEEILGITRSIWEKYVNIPVTEIWSDESVNVLLRHIMYYYESGKVSRDQARTLVEEYRELIRHIKGQAEHGKKYYFGRPESGAAGSYKLYYNELSISDNTIFYDMEGVKATFITYNMLNTLHTTDEVFSQNVEHHLDTVMKKSSLISSASEKTRNQVFNLMEKKVDEVWEKLK